MSRLLSKIKQHKRYVVLGDGQTEQYYLQHLKDILGYRYSIRPLLFNNITIEKASSLIKDLLVDGYDMVIYLTDYDTIVNQRKEVKFKKLLAKYQNSKNVLICETMPSIEFWFLLHFQKTTREFCNASEVLVLLTKHLKDYSKNEAYLKTSKWVETLCAHGKLEVASNNSSSILTEKENGDKGSHFPYSKAHIAIEYFEKQKTN